MELGFNVMQVANMDELQHRSLDSKFQKLKFAGKGIRDARHFFNYAIWLLRKKPWYWQALEKYTFQVISVENEPDQFRISDSWRDLVQDLACFSLELERQGAFNQNLSYMEAQAYVFGWFWTWARKGSYLVEEEEFVDQPDQTEIIDLRELVSEDGIR